MCSSHKKCLEYSLNVLTSAAGNAVYKEKLVRRKLDKEVASYFEHQARNPANEKEMKGKQVGKENQILETVSKLVFEAVVGLKPKKDEKPIVTAIRLVLGALAMR